jgi:hypothetical protein
VAQEFEPKLGEMRSKIEAKMGRRREMERTVAALEAQWAGKRFRAQAIATGGVMMMMMMIVLVRQTRCLQSSHI